MNPVKPAPTALSPDALLRPFQTVRQERRFHRRSSAEVFTEIYARGLWGRAGAAGGPYYSGHASHDPALVSPYVAAIGALLAGFSTPPNVVDLGCGDFAVGARVRPLCGRYVACDIVEPLIRHHAVTQRGREVIFLALDIARDPLPVGDVAFARQVFQYLSNDEIARALPRVAAAYRLLVVTELQPLDPGFVPNVDKPTGPGTRFESGSGVVLTAPPFSLRVEQTRTLCEVPAYGGVLRTVLHVIARG